MSLVILEESNPETIQRIVNDVNLMAKIKEVNFQRLKTEIVVLIEKKMKSLKEILGEEQKTVRNLVDWLSYAS